MLPSLMRPQFLETTIPFSAIIGAANPEAVEPDVQMDSIPMTLNIGGANEGLTTAEPRALSTLLDGIDWPR